MSNEKLRCGGLVKHIVVKGDDCKKYLDDDALESLLQILLHISKSRKKDGKSDDNEYIVINTDEPYINEIIEILKKNGHWGEGEQV